MLKLKLTEAHRLARTDIGIAGMVASALLFFTPLPAIRRIISGNNTQGLHPYVYLAWMMSCIFWIIHGSLTKNGGHGGRHVIIINTIGLVVESIFLIIFYTRTGMAYRRNIVITLGVEVLICVVVTPLVFKVLNDTELRNLIVGILCAVFGSIMYMSRMIFAKSVIQGQSRRIMLVSQIVGLVNGVLWVVYALLDGDLYTLIANGVGIICSLVQVGLIICYWTQTSEGVPPVV